MWEWNRTQQPRVRPVEMRCMRGACGVTRWDGESNGNVYERLGIGTHANEVMCDVQWVKRSTLGRFVHIERMHSGCLVKKVNLSELLGPSSSGRPLGRWKDRVKKYMCERGRV